MKIGTQLIAGFLLISLFVAIVGFVSFNQMSKIAAPLNSDIPKSISEISETSYLDGLAQFIRYYDEVLTQSARNYAFTHDKKWEERYMNIVPELDKIIKDAIEKGDETDKKFFSSVDAANLALVEMEEKSLKLVDEGNHEEAVKILESDEYWNQKKIYEQGLREYVANRGAEYDEALKASTQTLNAATASAKESIDSSKRTILLFVAISIGLAILLGFLISRSISGPISELSNVVESISKGNIETDISQKLKNSKSEIGRLAQAFDRTIVSLKLAMGKKGSKNDEKKE
ncbi:MAG TPA: methyl-accepting chemotaxis protein [Candidatus Nanoarchaeia archaeon]|nr:methyl-accepting chemotaxis protein [Candidatus Nanoarchaeia archaeon]